MHLPVVVIKIGITEDPDCGSGYDQITATATTCRPLMIGGGNWDGIITLLIPA
jgi:hypothetical protein